MIGAFVMIDLILNSSTSAETPHDQNLGYPQIGSISLSPHASIPIEPKALMQRQRQLAPSSIVGRLRVARRPGWRRIRMMEN
jgi:hypothetical protein